MQTVKGNKRLKQVVSLFGSSLIALPLGIVTSLIVTRYLGPQKYGDFQFVNNLFSLAVVLLTLGFYQAGNRALVLNYDPKIAKEYYGAEIVITAAFFFVLTIFLTFYAIFDPNIQKKQLSLILLCLIPFGWVFLLLKYFETLLQADNRIKLLIVTRLLPKIGFFLIILISYLLNVKEVSSSLAVVFASYLIPQVSVYCFALYKLNISFNNIKNRLIEIWEYNKSFGFNVYIGSVFSVGFSTLAGILISYFGEDNSGVGFYALALALTAPLGLIPNTIATTHYKDFSELRKIPRKLFLTTLGLSLSALVGLWIIVDPFVRFFYGEAYSSVILISFIVSFGITFHGMADFFNRYLGANGQGKALRNSSFCVGGSLFLFSLLLIPKYGEYGAALTRVASGLIYLITIVYFYRKYLNLSDNSTK